LYLGTEEDAEQKEKVSDLGITHVISIVGGHRYSQLYDKHMYTPLRDDGSSDLLDKLEGAYDFMVESQMPNNKLFIHCQLGQNRSASFVIGFLMRYRNMCLHGAYTFLKQKRELIDPHKKYIEQLRELDIQLHKVYSTFENFLEHSFTPRGTITIQDENFSKVASQIYKMQQLDNLEKGDASGCSDSPSGVENLTIGS